LLDDELTEALPVWSPDSSKIADAFDTDVMIYDAALDKPTQARHYLPTLASPDPQPTGCGAEVRFNFEPTRKK
jgi:hypothetical protein